jgi:chromosome segregation ATPase
VDEYFSALNISRQRESSLGDMFNQLRTENALLMKQLSDTQNELDKTMKDFSSLSKNYNEKSAQLDTFKNLFASIDASLLYLNERAKEIRFKANDIEDSLGDMDDSVAEVENNRVKSDLNSQHDSMDAALNQLFYSLDKLDTKLNDTEYYAGRIRNLQ